MIPLRQNPLYQKFLPLNSAVPEFVMSSQDNHVGGFKFQVKQIRGASLNSIS